MFAVQREFALQSEYGNIVLTIIKHMQAIPLQNKNSLCKVNMLYSFSKSTPMCQILNNDADHGTAHIFTKAFVYLLLCA